MKHADESMDSHLRISEFSGHFVVPFQGRRKFDQSLNEKKRIELSGLLGAFVHKGVTDFDTRSDFICKGIARTLQITNVATCVLNPFQLRTRLNVVSAKLFAITLDSIKRFLIEPNRNFASDVGYAHYNEKHQNQDRCDHPAHEIQDRICEFRKGVFETLLFIVLHATYLLQQKIQTVQEEKAGKDPDIKQRVNRSLKVRR